MDTSLLHDIVSKSWATGLSDLERESLIVAAKCEFGHCLLDYDSRDGAKYSGIDLDALADAIRRLEAVRNEYF